MYIQDMITAGIVVTYRDYRWDMPATTWTDLVLWKEAEVERSNAKQ